MTLRGAAHRVSIVIVVVSAMQSACASRQAPPAGTPGQTVVAIAVTEPPIVPIDPAALIRRGCFTCLERALEAARQQHAPQLAFEAATLLALRARELGIPPDSWIEQARLLAGDDSGLQLMLDVVEAIPGDPLAGVRDVVLSQTPGRRRAAELSTRWMDALASGPGSPEIRTYLRLALTCTSEDYRKMEPADVAAVIPEGIRDAPIVRYRLGICGSDHVSVLRSVRAADEEFVDADYPLGRAAVQARPYPDLDLALRLLQSAAAAFPRSPAIATTAGNVYQMIEAWTDGLAAYDAALALVPDHPDALIGRTITLSNLNRHQDAIASASRLIDQGTWFVAQALYWRSWNRFQLEEFLIARADADRARAMMLNPGVYLLSGLIDWKLDRLESAEREFEEALRMDFGQCEAATFLGGVRNQRSRLREALAAFTQAVQCYDLTLRLRREAIARLETADATPSHKAREIARYQRGIDQAEKRRAEAANGVDLLQKYLTSIQPQSPPRSR
jgi:tetratricopeptide (TPR) repeat protein